MRSFRFIIADISVVVQHCDDSLARTLEERFGPWKAAGLGPPDIAVTLLPGKFTRKLPPKAIRTYFSFDAKHLEFRAGAKTFSVFGDSCFVERDFDTEQFHLHYEEATAEVQTRARALLKWAVIKALEKRGGGYVHASAAQLDNTNVLFCGHSGAGKSSCLTRTLQLGGKGITDDSLLFKKGTLFPFDLSTTKKGDYATRFEGGTAVAEKALEISARPKEVHVALFPRAWEYGRSELRPLTREKAVALMWETYLRETQWNAFPSEAKQVRKKYERLIAAARCAELYTGYDEAEIRETLAIYLQPPIRRRKASA